MKTIHLALILSLSLVLGACQSPQALRTPNTLIAQSITPPRVAQQTHDEILVEGVKSIRLARFQRLDRNEDQRLLPGEVKDLDLRLPGVS